MVICLLDRGVLRTDSLIDSALTPDDWHTINPALRADDIPAWRGHRTRTAGAALYGNLVPVLTDGAAVAPPLMVMISGTWGQCRSAHPPTFPGLSFSKTVALLMVTPVSG